MTKRKGRFITRIGIINTNDEVLLNLLKDQGFHLRKVVRGENSKYLNDISSYDIFMEDDE